MEWKNGNCNVEFEMIHINCIMDICVNLGLYFNMKSKLIYAYKVIGEQQ